MLAWNKTEEGACSPHTEWWLHWSHWELSTAWRSSPRKVQSGWTPWAPDQALGTTQNTINAFCLFHFLNMANLPSNSSQVVLVLILCIFSLCKTVSFLHFTLTQYVCHFFFFFAMLWQVFKALATDGPVRCVESEKRQCVRRATTRFS